MTDKGSIANASSDSCLICGVGSAELISCPSCPSAKFCSERHLLRHKPDGRKTCFPFRVQSSDSAGHYLVAARDISAGELVMRDLAFVSGPLSKSAPVCLHCCKVTSREDKNVENGEAAAKILNEEQRSTFQGMRLRGDRCEKCALPLCQSGDCSSTFRSKHLTSECPILAETFSRAKDANRRRVIESTNFEGSPCPLYSCVTPLRLLLEKERRPEEWKDRMEWLMDHEEGRKRDQKSWMLNHVLVVGYLRGACRLSRFSSEEIHKAIGILRTNGVKLDAKPGHAMGIAVFPTYSLLNHSCICNTRTKKFVDEGEQVLELYAVMDIKKGEEITTRYTTPQWSTVRRQQLLQNHWYFSCHCKRCLDPSELGSMLNAIRCLNPDCKEEGFLLPLEPTKLNSDWKCTACAQEQPPARVMEVVMRAEVQVEKAASEEDLRRLLGDFTRSLLHPTHFLAIRLREKLIQVLKREMCASSADPLTVRRCLEEQVKYFGEICEAMVKVDPPADVWTETLARMEKDLARLKMEEKYKL